MISTRARLLATARLGLAKQASFKTRPLTSAGAVVSQISQARFNNTIAVGAYDNDYITLVLNDEHTLQYSTLFLRDACQGPESVDVHSKQKLFTTTQIAQNLKLNKPPKVVGDKLVVEWNQSGKIHTSEYSHRFLEKYSDLTSRRRDKYFEHNRILWNNKEIEKNSGPLNVSYSDYINKPEVFRNTVSNLNSYGIAFVNDIPEPELKEMNEDNASSWPVSEIASKFGYVKKTFYGTLFDVKNKKDATNIAYTNTFLPLHMDLLYYESPPGLQLLHAIQNSTEGGDNIFCDSFLAAQHVREKDPRAYSALTEVPISYKYDNDNEYYYFQRPLIVEKEEIIDPRTNYPVIKEVNYSPPFQGPFELGITKNNSGTSSKSVNVLTNSARENSAHYLFKDFIRGLQLFEDFINDPANHFQIKIPEGSCVVFDNRRILHSRLEFSDKNGGDRWLMGCYVDGDSFRSKIRLVPRGK